MINLSFLLDSSNVKITDSSKDVFHAAIGRYELNYHDAQRLCQMKGAALASYDQLHAAWQDGLELCLWAYI